jgi:hypothetical protein
MNYIELEVVPAWRYCNVKAGEKIPYPAGWQNNPKTIKNIESVNVGLLLGPVSGGLIALDFDGPSAWTWFDQRIGCALPQTVTWTSGKDRRCQMAFWIDQQYWDWVRTQKITHTKDALVADGEGFEFRWTGCQSVMPPSTLADGRQYAWLSSPTETKVAKLPDEIMCYWLTMCNPEPIVAETVEHPPMTEAEIIKLAEEFKALYPQLDFDTWAQATWAFCNTIGYADGIALMKYHYPEQKPGEYRALGSKPRTSGPLKTIGYIKRLIGNRTSKLTRLELELKKKYNI